MDENQTPKRKPSRVLATYMRQLNRQYTQKELDKIESLKRLRQTTHDLIANAQKNFNEKNK